MTVIAPEEGPATLPAAVRQLLAARGLADRPVRLAVPSSTRIDTGGWLRGGRLWAAVVADRLVLAAAGPRPYLLELPIAAVSRAVYNHVTGELSFPPSAAGPSVPPLRLDPLTARSLASLAQAPSGPLPPSGTSSHA